MDEQVKTVGPKDSAATDSGLLYTSTTSAPGSINRLDAAFIEPGVGVREASRQQALFIRAEAGM